MLKKDFICGTLISTFYILNILELDEWNISFHWALENNFLSCFYEDFKKNLSTICRFADLTIHKNLELIFVSVESKFYGIFSLTYNKIPSPV